MDSNQRTLFIKGISQNTDESLLRQYFSHFGEVLDVTMKRDRATGHHRGFGFVEFSDPSVTDRVLRNRHRIDHREVYVRRSVRREDFLAGRWNFDSEANVRTKKIFVGGLPFSLTLEQFRAYFEKYGPVSDAVIMIDQQTQRPKGYGFVSFYSEDSVDRVLDETVHNLNGSRIQVKRRRDANPVVASAGAGVAGGFPVYGGSGGSGHRVASASGSGTGVFLGNGGAGAASASGGRPGAFPVYGGSSGSGYEGHMDSNRYMQPQNIGSSYPPYGASGYSDGSYGVGYGGIGGYGNPAGAPYGNPGVLGTSDPRSAWGDQVPSGYGNVEYGNAAPCSAGPGSAVIEQIGGSGGNGNHQANNGQDVMVEVIQNMLWWKACSGLMMGYGGYGWYGTPYGNPGIRGAGPRSSWGGQVPSGYGNVEYGNAARGGGFGPGSAVMEQVSGSAGYGYGGVGGYGYPAGAPYGNPGVPGASDPSSSWGAQVSSSYGNVEYGNAARGGGFGPGSAVREQFDGSAGYGYGGNDSLYGTPSAYGAVDGQYSNIHNTHGSGSGYADASNGSGGYGNHQRTNRQAGYGGSCGKGKQVQQ